MKILFIGGTKYVGRNIVEDALLNGHEVYLLNRGQTNASLFPGAKKYVGDRRDIAKIIPSNVSFDLVIDTCGYHPTPVEVSCQFLKDFTDLYVFISTISVYSDFSTIGLKEDSPLATLDQIPPKETKVTNEIYGALKALCESKVLKHFSPDRFLILRPGIIVGPHDNFDRFGRLLKLIMQDEIQVPNDPEAMIQFVDIRAISKFILSAKSKNNRGIFNTVGPKSKLGLLEFINLAKQQLNPNLEIQLSNSEVKDFPMYPQFKKNAGFYQVDGSKAYDSGFPIKAVQETIQSVADFMQLRKSFL